VELLVGGIPVVEDEDGAAGGAKLPVGQGRTVALP
jgi:hypothetical protein